MSTPELTVEYVISEVRKLQYLYQLKKEIRYAQNRQEEDSTESVAEHIYGMHILAAYFLPLVDTKGEWNKARIYEMITQHDIDEIETGDIVGYLKSDTERENGISATQTVIKKSPLHMQANMQSLAKEYGEQSTIESRFVKAIDKFEPLIQIYSEEGRQVLFKNKTTAYQSSSIKEPYLKEFPLMLAYNIIIQRCMEEEGFFSE
jgi:5'-deoxynucleotidase YfbR-like HD superfamily hydrolase